MILNNFISHYWQHFIVAMLAISVFCFWLFLYPFIPVVREMSILFLWNTDYLMERLAIPGGLAQYLGEGVAQFFVNPFNGAIIYAVLFVVAQLLSMKLLKQFFPTIKKQYQFVLSLIPPIVLWGLAMLPHVPLTPTVAVLLVMGAGCWMMGKSVTWPRPSYDGRYLMYTQVDYGYFSIWHPEADLWLLDLSTGETRALDEVNSDCAESLHSWSSNSRWFLFNSRRDDGLYSRIYLSMMGKDGRATKPFMLPQRNPKEFYRQLLYSYNTPDFTSRPVNSNARQIGRNIESDLRTDTKVEVYE